MKATIIIISILFQFAAFNASSANATQTLNPIWAHTDCYIDDIPFDTEKVAKAYHQSVFSEPLDALAYVDDIPFETEEVFVAVKATEAMQVNFEMQAETLIEDIPFNTERIAAQEIESNIGQMKFERMSK